MKYSATTIIKNIMDNPTKFYINIWWWFEEYWIDEWIKLWRFWNCSYFHRLTSLT